MNAVPSLPPVGPVPPPLGVLVWLSPLTVSVGVLDDAVDEDVPDEDEELDVEVEVDVDVDVEVDVDVDVEVDVLLGLGEADSQWLSLRKASLFSPSNETVATSPTSTVPGVSTEKLPPPLCTMS